MWLTWKVLPILKKRKLVCHFWTSIFDFLILYFWKKKFNIVLRPYIPILCVSFDQVCQLTIQTNYGSKFEWNILFWWLCVHYWSVCENGFHFDWNSQGNFNNLNFCLILNECVLWWTKIAFININYHDLWIKIIIINIKNNNISVYVCCRSTPMSMSSNPA